MYSGVVGDDGEGENRKWKGWAPRVGLAMLSRLKRARLLFVFAGEPSPTP